MERRRIHWWKTLPIFIALMICFFCAQVAYSENSAENVETLLSSLKVEDLLDFRKVDENRFWVLDQEGNTYIVEGDSAKGGQVILADHFAEIYKWYAAAFDPSNQGIEGFYIRDGIKELSLSEIKSCGYAGETVRWILTNGGLLYVFGNGMIDDFEYPVSTIMDTEPLENAAPWTNRWNQVTEIIIEERITGIGSFDFYGLEELRSVSIPASVESISDASIWNCPNLESIDVAEENMHYQSANGVLFNKDMSRLMIYPANKTGEIYQVPDSVTEILSFQECKLAGIDIPDSVTSIWEGAFQNCVYLREIELPEKLQVFDFGMFENCSALKKISIPAGVKKVYCNEYPMGLYSLRDIQYAGTEEEWNTITINIVNNAYLAVPTIYFSDGSVRTGLSAEMNLTE